ncbi:MAG: membrane dipeptidase [Bacilli bacterium]|nr:membrane dipeptidase [Bacilli bacterium]
MFDTHYDLLTIAYVAYLKDDYSYLKEIANYFNENNVKGVIANLYFMSREEMKEELHENYYRDDVSVLEMFKVAKDILDIFLPNKDILYSIEGADYIKDEDELEELYNNGLDALILCWNTESKYGSGNRSNKGLTLEGKKLLTKAIDLGMGIDLSHANVNTFYDMVDLVKHEKEEGKDVCVYASHSNVYAICPRSRSLEFEQLEKLKEIDALVGAFSNKGFIIRKGIDEESVDARKMYLLHLIYLSKVLGPNKVMTATDDMTFLKDTGNKYALKNIYEYKDIYKELSKDLESVFGEDKEKIIYNNAKEQIYDKIKKKREKRRGL